MSYIILYNPTTTCMVPVCRCCMAGAADSKLYDIHEDGLDKLYEGLTTFAKPVCDRLPPYVCFYCRALLLKYADFKNKCLRSQTLFGYLLMSNIQITAEHINNIDRYLNKLALPLTINRDMYTIDAIHIDIKEDVNPIKEEIDIEDNIGDGVANDNYISNHTNQEQATFIVIENIDNSVTDNVNNKEIKVEKVDSDKTVIDEDLKVSSENNTNDKTKENKNTEKVIVGKGRVANNCDEEAEVIKTIKELCSDSDLDDVLNDIAHEEEIHRSLGEDDRNSVASDAEIEIEDILRSLYKGSDPDINELIKSIRSGNLNIKAPPRRRRKKIDKRFKQFEDETFSKQYEVAIMTLTLEEQKAEIEARKEATTYKEAQYKCEKCYTVWLREETLSNHMEKHDPRNGQHCCEVCGVRFTTASRLRQHSKLHRYKLICKICGFQSRSKNHAQWHHKLHTGHTVTCGYCGARHSSRQGHLSHVRLHHPAEHAAHACARCGEVFVGARGLRAHRARSRGRCRPAPEPAASAPAPAPAPDSGGGEPAAGAGSASESASGSPSASASGPGAACPSCGERFLSAGSLRVHERRVHQRALPRAEPRPRRPPRRPGAPGAPLAPARARERLICEVCGRRFQAQCMLRYHLMTHQGVLPFPCPHCPKAFSTKATCQEHVRSHTGEKPFKCAQCGRGFASQCNYYRHLRSHAGVKKYKCDICDKLFTQSSGKNMHIRTVHMKIPLPPRRRRYIPRGASRGGLSGRGASRGAARAARKAKVSDSSEDSDSD